jgi:hypothetical protein
METRADKMREPRRNHYMAPAAGADSRAALDVALHQLAAARNLDGTDAASALHLLASLAAETEARFPQLITDARHHGCSWAGIADLLGVTRASAWQRWTPKPQRPTATAPSNRPTRRRSTPKSQPQPQTNNVKDRTDGGHAKLPVDGH